MIFNETNFCQIFNKLIPTLRLKMAFCTQNPLTIPIFVVLLLLLLSSPSNQQPGPVETVSVMTSYGELQGFVHVPSDSLQKVDVFFGVPFAEAPTGILRFERPLPPRGWRGVRLAGEEMKPPACVPHARPENNVTQCSEDCLFLNIFAPHREPNDTTTLHPVLFIIHGGAYEIGSSAGYSNYDLLGARFVNQGIVFVAIQYRLGVLGFATTGDSELPGNLGIRDQIAALRYVKENIRAFGGDPQRVTVLGYSAGSGSTGLLSTSPAAKDYFHQTVRMSGAILSSSGSGTFVPEATLELANALGCPTTEVNRSSSVKRCLREKSVDELFDGVQQIGPAPLSYAIAKFGPNRMDSELFPADHLEMIPKSPPKRTMLGFTELDFLLMTLVMDSNSTISMLSLTNEQIEHYGLEQFKASIRDFVAKEKHFGDQTEAVRAEILDFYVNQYEPSVGQKDNVFFLRLYSMVCSDLMMVVPMLWEAQIRIGANWPIFIYENKYFNPTVYPPRVKVHATYHDYDHDLLFKKELIRDEEDRKMSDFLIESVVNFVRNGDPSTATVKWEPTANFSLSESQSISHMEIDKPQPNQKMGMEGEVKRLHFWLQLGQKYGGKYDLVRGIYGNAAAIRNELAWTIATVTAFVIFLVTKNLF